MTAPVVLPNIRRLFVPDPGSVMVDADLAGADAQVVAWEAEDEDLKAAFRAGLKVHLKNAREIFPEKTKDLTDAQIKATDKPQGIYHDCKRAVHATNYGASARTLAITLFWKIVEAENFQSKWFSLHPGIRGWHRRIDAQLRKDRTIWNRFGYRIIYFDRIDQCFTDALAWIPQSTVAITTERGAIQLSERCPYVEHLLQVHDSIVFQVPISCTSDRHFREIRAALSIEIPYPDPLTIQWKLSTSQKSWGDCEELPTS